MNDHFKAFEYKVLSAGEDGRYLIEVLEMYLKPASSILELGMGPGRDLDILKEKYRVTGSDISNGFLDLYRAKNPQADLLILDAASIETSGKFDCIYSNKVLHQLSRSDLKRSFARQVELLNPGGLLCHSFWYGDKTVEHRGAKFEYYTENTILEYISSGIKLLYFQTYMQMIPDDSALFIFMRME
ncbi:MAG TPA: class I SAM-dependent methyltransferase [Bacteroidales bacterium]|nr:class I SAM-dependent methyltransferase [Bacteroidales bacterium]HRX96876.1 class I SAM-dependent methyltransferase [Bacteroidales bacterium]